MEALWGDSPAVHPRPLSAAHTMCSVISGSWWRNIPNKRGADRKQIRDEATSCDDARGYSRAHGVTSGHLQQDLGSTELEKEPNRIAQREWISDRKIVGRKIKTMAAVHHCSARIWRDMGRFAA